MEIISLVKKCRDRPKLSIIVVTKNLEGKSVEQMIGSTSVITLEFELLIIVQQMNKKVDLDQLKKQFDAIENLTQILAVSMNSDRGLTFGRNLGAKLAVSNVLVFSDDDIILVEDVSPLVKYLENNFCHGVQPLLLKYSNPNIVDSAGDQIIYRKGLYHAAIKGAGEDLHELRGRLVLEQLPSMRGAFMVIRKDVLFKLGGFDESFFFNLDDVDLCWRMVLAGFNIVFMPTVKVLHIGGSTSNNTVNERVFQYCIVNYHSLQLKIVSYILWPYVIVRFLLFAAGHEIKRFSKGNVNPLSVVYNFLVMNKMFSQRFRNIIIQRKILRKKFKLSGKKAFIAMASGNRLIPTET
jgi:GT2 family glycosyltransferase